MISNINEAPNPNGMTELSKPGPGSYRVTKDDIGETFVETYRKIARQLLGIIEEYSQCSLATQNDIDDFAAAIYELNGAKQPRYGQLIKVPEQIQATAAKISGRPESSPVVKPPCVETNGLAVRFDPAAQLRRQLGISDTAPRELEDASGQFASIESDDITWKPVNPDDMIDLGDAEEEYQGATGASYEEPETLGGREVSFAPPASDEWDPRLDFDSNYGTDQRKGTLVSNVEGESAARNMGQAAVRPANRHLDPTAVLRDQKTSAGEQPKRLVLPEEMPDDTPYRDYVETILNPHAAVTALADGTILTRQPNNSIFIELPDGRTTFEVTGRGSLISSVPMSTKEIYASLAAERQKIAEDKERARPKPIASLSGTTHSYKDGAFPFGLTATGAFYLEKRETTFFVRDLTSGKSIGGLLADWEGARELPCGYYYLPEKIQPEVAVAAIESDLDANRALADATPALREGGGIVSWQMHTLQRESPK
ncbi:MAG: hypothetical protein WC901_05375 [Candidatus Margulisiibacteriota bacterium]